MDGTGGMQQQQRELVAEGEDPGDEVVERD
jgi:hypothetical protein